MTHLFRRHWLLSTLFFGALFLAFVVIGFDTFMSQRELNTDGPAEAERLIAAIAPLRQQIGDHRRYNHVWHGHSDWFAVGGGTMTAYVPVRGDKSSGTLYIEDWNDIGAWKVRQIRFQPEGQSRWVDYTDKVTMDIYYGDESTNKP